MIERRVPRSSNPIWLSTRPSRASNPTCRSHFCQRSTLPSSVKLGPSGCVITIGFRSVRSGPVSSGSSKFPFVSGISAGPSSMIRTTRRSIMSTNATSWSTGCPQA